MEQCKFCTYVSHENIRDFEEPRCSMIRRWYKSEFIQDELDKDHRDEFNLFERRYIPQELQKSPIWYLDTPGKMLLPVNYCPKCGRELK